MHRCRALHGNPGDYAWGPGGLDQVVTQLLNQFEGGAPPLAKADIQKLPEVAITSQNVGTNVLHLIFDLFT
jgi:E3 ubiquitin-protein ligase RNF115/126